MIRKEPTIVDYDALARFKSLVRGMGLDPEEPWVGGYVPYEWKHGRFVFECSQVDLNGAEVLEFGCNVGAMSVVLAALGARVTAIDVNPDFVRLAQANCRAYGFGSAVEVLHIPDTTRLPFLDEHFDAVVCSSVLEYVPHDMLPFAQKEIARVLKTSGTLFVMGTSNRLWPREVHSRRWFVNYLPRFLDGWSGKAFQRGVSPWRVRYGFGAFDNLDWLDRGTAMHQARIGMQSASWKLICMQLARIFLRTLRISLGAITPSMSFTLRKR